MSDCGNFFYLGVIYSYKNKMSWQKGGCVIFRASGAAPSHIVSSSPVPLAAKMFKTAVVSGREKKYFAHHGQKIEKWREVLHRGPSVSLLHRISLEYESSEVIKYVQFICVKLNYSCLLGGLDSNSKLVFFDLQSGEKTRCY